MNLLNTLMALRAAVFTDADPQPARYCESVIAFPIGSWQSAFTITYQAVIAAGTVRAVIQQVTRL